MMEAKGAVVYLRQADSPQYSAAVMLNSFRHGSFYAGCNEQLQCVSEELRSDKDLKNLYIPHVHECSSLSKMPK